MARFSGRTAVITGGGTGIGLATGRLLAEQGATVVVGCRSRERGEEAVRTIRADGGRARFVPVDVGDDAQVAALAEAAAAEHGTIDLWFGNAGGEGPIGGPETWDDAAIADLLSTNVKGVLSGIRHAAEHMCAGGMIINTASFVGTVLPVPIAVPYAATKAAVVALGESAALALDARGIGVVSICPWVIDTPMVDRLTGGAGAEARGGFAADFNPSTWLVPAAHVARAVADLWDGTTTAEPGAAYLIDHGPTVTRLLTAAVTGIRAESLGH